MAKNRGIKSKLLLLCGSISVGTVVVGAVGYLSLKGVSSDYGWIVNKTTPKVELSNQMYVDYLKARVGFMTLGIAGLSKAEAQATVQNVHEAIDHYEAANKTYVELQFLPGQKELYDQVNRTWGEFKQTGDQIFSLYESGSAESQRKMLDLLLIECPKKAKLYDSTIKALLDFHKKVQNDRTLSANETTSRLNALVLALIVCGVATSLFASFYFSKALSRNLLEVVHALTSGSSETDAIAAQLSSASTNLSSVATEQAAAIQETSASVEEIRTMVEKNTQNAASSAQKSDASRDHAERGQRAVKEMIGSIGQIKGSNEAIMSEVMESNRRISEIIQMIQEIGTKTKVINDIVFQTKLLSFNAAVESARAGEHGKGFAVVAEEVGNLAQMSGSAAKEISELLESSISKVQAIVNETKKKVEGLIADARTKVDRGSEIAQECDTLLEEIVNSARSVSEMAQEISHASHEQSSGISEIAKAIQELDSTTQVNAAVTQETAASAGVLSQQVISLKEIAGRLRIVAAGDETNGTVARFVWKNLYSLGIPEMDDEHKILIEKINAMALAIETSHGKSAGLIRPFQDLASYTQEHFSDEEKFMASIRYPELQKHQEVHKCLLARVFEFGAQIQNERLNGAELMSFLNDWLIQHILGVDMRYSRFSKTGARPSKKVA